MSEKKILQTLAPIAPQKNFENNIPPCTSSKFDAYKFLLQV